MKTQSSLEVPKQVRSASFDEIQLENKRQQNAAGSQDANGLLNVPQFPSQRSKSVDSGGSEESSNFLEVPKRFQRRKSSGARPYCVHCLRLEEFNKLHPPEDIPPEPPDLTLSMLSISDTSSSELEVDEEIFPECSITVTLSPTLPVPVQSPPPISTSPTIECFSADDLPSPSSAAGRRKSIHRQEAFFAEPTGTSLENMSEPHSDVASEGASEGALSEGEQVTIPGLVVHDIYLQVPDLKRDRAASVDSCFSKVSQGKTEELQHSGVSLEVPVGPNVALRSRSVDIVLPTDEQARYKALAMAAPPGTAPPTTKGYVIRCRTQSFCMVSQICMCSSCLLKIFCLSNKNISVKMESRLLQNSFIVSHLYKFLIMSEIAHKKKTCTNHNTTPKLGDQYLATKFPKTPEPRLGK